MLAWCKVVKVTPTPRNVKDYQPLHFLQKEIWQISSSPIFLLTLGSKSMIDGSTLITHLVGLCS